MNSPKSCRILHSQYDQAKQVGSSKEKKAKNKKNKKHRGGGSETPAYEEGGRAGEKNCNLGFDCSDDNWKDFTNLVWV